MRTSYPYEFGANTAGWFALWVAVASISWLIAAACVDGEGAKAWNHREPLPKGVSQVTPYTYVIEVDSGVQGTDLCKKASSGGEAEVTQFESNKKGAVLVQCSRGQTWGETRARSQDFSNAALAVVKSPLWIVPNAIFFALLSIWPLSMVMQVRAGRREVARKDKAHREREAQLNASAYESERAALGAAWARNEITDEQFEAKVAQLVRKHNVDGESP